MPTEQEAADEYFNSLISRVDRVTGTSSALDAPPMLRHRLLSEHYTTAPCCRAAYDHLIFSKRVFLFFFFLLLQLWSVGVYMAFLGERTAENVANFSLFSAWIVTNLVSLPLYWSARTCLRRPDKVGGEWFWPASVSSVVLLTTSSTTWLLMGVAGGCAPVKECDVLYQHAVGLYFLLLFTGPLVEAVLLVACFQSGCSLTKTTADNFEFLKDAGLEGDEVIESYVPPPVEPAGGASMPSTVDNI